MLGPLKFEPSKGTTPEISTGCSDSKLLKRSRPKGGFVLPRYHLFALGARSFVHG